MALTVNVIRYRILIKGSRFSFLLSAIKFFKRRLTSCSGKIEMREDLDMDNGMGTERCLCSWTQRVVVDGSHSAWRPVSNS